MKPIKMFGLAMLAALMAMAFVGAGSAMAESTSLCSSDPTTVSQQSGCGVSHVHEETLSGAKGKLLSSVLNVECDVLFLGEVTAEGSPLVISGNFTYANCNSGCTATEENGPSEIKVLREGTELASVTGKGLVHLVCSGFINCRYTGEGLKGHGLGPLTSSETNGSVNISEQSTAKESGTFCPATAKLDITTTPLEPVYIGGGELLHYCVKDEHNTNGRYKDPGCEEAGAASPFDLVVGPPGFKVGDMVCVNQNDTETGLYEGIKDNKECIKDNKEKLSESLYELAEIIVVE